MKTKHFILTLLALLTCISVSAYDDCIDGICYNLSMRFFNGKVEYIATVTYQNYTNDEYNVPFSNYDGDITIPSTIVSKIEPANHIETSYDNHYNVVAIGDEAFAHSSRLTSVTIPNSVTSIGKNAFADCSGLKSVTIPNSVTSIGKQAFVSCSQLESLNVDSENIIYDSRNNCNAIIETGSNTLIVGCKNSIIPNSVKSIGEYAFTNSGLTSITIPDGVTSIGRFAFYSCSGLTSITIGNSVASIGAYAFSECKKLTSVIIGNYVVSIGDYAFDNCIGLTSITIPNSVIEIGDWAFNYCIGLTSVTIGNSVASIGTYAFSECKKLTSITVPNSVTSIGNWAFEYCSSLTIVNNQAETPQSISSLTFSNRANATLYVPAGRKAAYEAADYWKEFKEIKEILPEGSTFTALTEEGVEMTFKVISESNMTCMVGTEEYGVASIADDYSGGITIPSEVNGYTVTRVGKWALCGRSGLTSVSIPETVTSIGTQAFNFTGLTAITLPGNLKTIEDYVFQGCTGITSVTIPASVTRIADGTFDAGNMNLASIEVESGNQVYDSRNDCNAIIETATNTLIQGCKNSTIPNTVKIIADEAFINCTGLTSINIPSSVTSIGNRAFFGCSNLASVSLPENLKTIDGEAFSWCESFISIVIPASVTSIGDYIFAGCIGLTSIVVEDGNTVYDCRDNCSAIIETSTNTLIAGCKNTIIPNTVTCIGNGAFNDLTNLTSIEIPSSVTTLKWWAFHDCGLTSINIPAGVTTIEAGAFEACDNLTSVTVNNPVPVDLSCGGIHTSYVFSNYANATLYVPAGSKSAYEAADYWKDFKEIKEIGADVVFTANTPEGVEMTFKVISESDKTCMVGTEEGEHSVHAIADDYSGGITIPSKVNGYTVTRVGKWAFSWIGGLTSVSIPETVTSIGTQAFNFTSLTSVTLPNKLESIEDGVFQSCRVLKSITIPSGVTTIGQCPFDDCQKLVSITIPASLTSIQDPFANGCIGLTSIVVEEGNPRYDSRNDCNAVIETATNSLIAGCKNTVIPNTVTSIARHAFVVNSSLTSINIPEGVKSIGYRAFAFCENLSSIIIPSSVTSIDSEVFRGCESLTSVAVMNPVPVTIEEYTFSNRSNATLYVPAGSKAEYEAADYWKDFKEIVEIDTDISQLDNAIYIEPFTARVGEDVRMSINLKNAEAATAYVFDLVLPEGITVATNDKGKYIDELSDRHDDHTRTINYKGENTYSFSTLSGNSEELTGNDGPIRFVTLHVDDAMEEGVYPILIKNASYSKPNGNLVALAATKSSVTIEDYVLGDVNGNGGVDIGDAVSIVNYLVGKESSNFVAKAADTNKNGQIDIGDAVTIVNLLVGKITSLTREFNIIWDEKEPE